MGGVRQFLTFSAVLAGLLAPTTAASAEGDDRPSAKKIAKASVGQLGKDAIPATLLALDQGYSGKQLIEAAIDVLLQPSGLISDAQGKPVKPAGRPAGVITGAPPDDPAAQDLEAPVSIESVRAAVPTTTRAAVEELTDIFAAAARGYPADAVIVDGLLADGFATGFTQPGIIKGVPKPGEPPDPDLLDDLLADIGKKEDKAAPKDQGSSSNAKFRGELTLGANWANSNGVGTPTLTKSSVRLRIKDERLVGSYALELAIPPEGGANCATTATYKGTFDLPPDGPGWTGAAQGTWTWTLKPDARCGPPPGIFGLNWQATALRVADERLSGEMSNPSDGQGMTMTFEARQG